MQLSLPYLFAVAAVVILAVADVVNDVLVVAAANVVTFMVHYDSFWRQDCPEKYFFSFVTFSSRSKFNPTFGSKLQKKNLLPADSWRPKKLGRGEGKSSA